MNENRVFKINPADFGLTEEEWQAEINFVPEEDRMNLNKKQEADLDKIFKMNDNFDLDLEDNIPDYEDLNEEEILARQKELYNLSKEGKEMLRDIRGIQNSRIIKLESLVYNSIKLVTDSDDEIDDIEFSPEYMKFITWYDDVRREKMFYERYGHQEEIFEAALNDGLEDEDEDNIFAYFKKKYIEKVRGITSEAEEPLSGLEVEAGKRFEILSTSEVDIIKLFQTIDGYPDEMYDEKRNMTWESLKSLL